MVRAFFFWVAMSTAAVAAEALVVFSADWCGPCKRFHRDYESNPALAGGRAVRMVDVDSDSREAKKYRVRNTPTFVLEEDGREIRRTVGYSGPEPLKRWLAGH